MKLIHKIFSVSVLALVLNSCAFLAIGGLAMAGVSVFTDARTTGAQLEDKNIFVKTHRQISKQYGKTVDVSITSYDRDVLLTGFVPSQEAKQNIAQLVKQIDNVEEVYNELYVGDSISIWSKAQDTTLTGRIRTQLLKTKELSSNFFKVTSNNSTAYVLGIASPEQKRMALEVIRSVKGVDEVVSYIKTKK